MYVVDARSLLPRRVDWQWLVQPHEARPFDVGVVNGDDAVHPSDATGELLTASQSRAT